MSARPADGHTDNAVSGRAPMRILGIDPGSRLTGFGLVVYEGDRARYVDAGAVRTTGDDFNQRLRQIHETVGEVIERLQPDQLAVERVFVARNASTALKLGAARSAAICASFAFSLPIYEYSPREVKLAVTGRGAADKGQVQHMVKALLSLTGDIQADAADALAIAMCHGNTVRLRTLKARAAGDRA